MSRSPNIDVSSPGIRRQARRFELLLKRALSLAARRLWRTPELAALCKAARVEGASKTMSRSSTITFEAPSSAGGLQIIYDWSSMERCSPVQLATDLEQSLRWLIADRRALAS